MDGHNRSLIRNERTQAGIGSLIPGDGMLRWPGERLRCGLQIRQQALEPAAQVIFQLRSEVCRLGVGVDTTEQRTVLVLSDIQGLSYQEVAEAMDLSLGTVKSRLSRGRAKLRDYLQQQRELLPSRYRLRDDTEAHQSQTTGSHSA